MSTEMKLEKLKEQKASINKQIKEAEKSKAKREADLYAKRCEIVGAAVLAELNDNQELGQTINPIINARTKSPKARRILGLT